MKHLLLESDDLMKYEIPFQEIGTTKYLYKRIQFWKYRKKRTMGRPILMLWRSHE